MSSFRDKFRRLRRTLSLKRRKSHSKKSTSNQNWENDSVTIGQGGLSFPVKYLGWLEVSESRGTQVCSQAAHQMKMSAAGKKKQRVTLWVTEDTLRVIDDETKSLVMDQVIEKVSFCTPDPHDEKLFSYICRDGTSRRWLCHSFRGLKDSGERISHAVGCAFAACLQKKQQQNQQNQNFQRGNASRKTLEKRQNGVVLPQESVQIIQQINQEEQEQRMQKAIEKHAPSTPTAIKDASDTPVPVSPTSKGSAPTFARPRPSPVVDVASCTRHMSLKYRSKSSSSGCTAYQALTEYPLPPRIPYTPEEPSKMSTPISAVGGHGPAQPVANDIMWLSGLTASVDQRQGHDLIFAPPPSQPNPFSVNQHAVAAQPVVIQQQAGWKLGMMQPPAEQKPNPFAQSGWSAQPVAASANPFGERFV